jgi:Tol biopolymer transport system component
VSDIVQWDRTTDSFGRITHGLNGAAPNGNSISPVSSFDGNVVAFTSRATNLLARDDQHVQDIYVFTRSTGTLQRASVTATGTSGFNGSGASSSLSISADGRFVPFSSFSPLVPTDSDDQLDIFVKDLQTGAVDRASVLEAGVPLGNGNEAPFLTPSARFVGFTTFSKRLPGSASDTIPHACVYDRATQTSTVIDPGVAHSKVRGLSDNGQVVVYGIGISGKGGLSVFDGASSSTVVLAGTNAPAAAITPDGRRVAFAAATATGSYELRLYDRVSGQIRVLPTRVPLLDAPTG